MTTTVMTKGAKAALVIFFLFRFCQIAAVSIGGFIYSYLIWHHTHHYCVYYPNTCWPNEMANVKVPWQYILVTFTVCSQ